MLVTAEAIRTARERGLDLIEVSPLANPPVCKFVNYGQFRYEVQKKERKQKIKQHKTEIKGIRLSTTISEHDTLVRVERAKKFLDKGNKVHVELLLRGRQKMHPEIGRGVMEKFMISLNTMAVIESPISQQGNKLSALLMPKK